MREVEVTPDEWARIKQRLMTSGEDAALYDYKPPVKLTCGDQWVIYEKEGFEDDSDTDN